MSRPLAQTPRPVNRLRAPPMAKCASMLIASDTQIALPWSIIRNGRIGMNAPTAVAVPVITPSFSGASSAGWMFSSSRTIASSARSGILHHRVRRFARAIDRQPLRFVDQRQLLLLEIRHQPHLVTLHLDLVRVDLRLAFCREVAARAHRQRVGNRSGDAADDHDVRGDVRADHAGDEAEVRRQPVIEPVNDAAQHAAGAAGVPRFPFAAHCLRQLARVDGGVGCDIDRGLVREPIRGPARQPEIRLHFAPLFGEHHRQDQ